MVNDKPTHVESSNRTSRLAHLPPELYSAILNHVELYLLQATTCALLRALPTSPIPLHHLYLSVVLQRPPQVIQLYKRLALGPNSEREKGWIKEFSLKAWGADADVLNNMLHILPRLRYLHVHVGTSFAPEHLDEMFEVPRPTIEHLSLRFRPYVERATYYQFLKGSYFDSMLEHLAKWPEAPRFQHLSIVQDPIPTRIAVNDQTSGTDPSAWGLNSRITASSARSTAAMSFAQPIVFFSIDPISTLARSPSVAHVVNLRFRIPSRSITHTLCVPQAFPSVTFLDLSTTLVNEDQGLPLILTRFPRVEHLILDASGLCGYGKEREGWRELGKSCAMAGLKRSREREGEVKAWWERMARTADAMDNASAASAATGQQDGAPQPLELGRPARRSRRPKPMAFSTFSIRVRNPGLTPASNDTAGGGSEIPTLHTPKIKILPSPSRLKTLCAAGSQNYAQPEHSKFDEWRQEFEQGWRQGVVRLRESWSRTIRAVGQTATVLRFDDDGTVLAGGLDEGMAGLVDVVGGGNLEEMMSLIQGWDEPPLLCFGLEEDNLVVGMAQDGTNKGSKLLAPHIPGCGHEIGWGIWSEK